MSFDFLVDRDTNDLVYQDGTLVLTKNKPELLRQRLNDVFKTWTGEWFNNTVFGAIDRQFLFAHGVTKAEIDAFFQSIVLSYDEVLFIDSWESELDPISRSYDLKYVVKTDYGVVSGFTTTSRPDIEIDYTQVMPPSTDLPCNTPPGLPVGDIDPVDPGNPCPLPLEQALQDVYDASAWDESATTETVKDQTFTVTISSCNPHYILFPGIWDNVFGYDITATVTAGGDAIIARYNPSKTGTIIPFPPPALEDLHFDTATITSGQVLDMSIPTMDGTEWIMVAVAAAESGTSTTVDVVISTIQA